MPFHRTVLIVDDNEINRLNLRLLLKSQYQVIEAGDVATADEALSSHRVDLLVLDLALPPEPDNPQIGMAYLQRLQQDSPETPVVVITGHDERELAQQAMNLGASDFFGKPFNPDEVHEAIDRGISLFSSKLREQELKHALQIHVNHQLLGESAAMQALRLQIANISATPSSVLIRGETGSGKELVANQLHLQSGRFKAPFIAINCAAMSEEHLENELFGHEKGAFPSAEKRKLGWFERASGGTLFLDEISSLPRAIQAKLLRVLEHGEFSRLGGESMIRCDVRLFCSTTEDLEALVRDHVFRDDLYYRINVLEIHVPPLRSHLEDLPLLCEAIRLRKAALCGRQVEGFSDIVMEQMARYSWPGNVRELENVIERAVVLANSSIVETLPSLDHAANASLTHDALEQWFSLLPDSGVRADKALAEFEKRLLQEALQRNQHIKARAGRWLGFGNRSKDKMRYLCDKYDLLPEGDSHG